MRYKASEILNIEYHTGILILKALNRFGNTVDAAKALGMSERNVWRLRLQYHITQNRFNKIFEVDLKSVADAKRKNYRAVA